MDAKQGAELVKALGNEDPSGAAGVLNSMSTDKAAELMRAMDRQDAAATLAHMDATKVCYSHFPNAALDYHLCTSNSGLLRMGKLCSLDLNLSFRALSLDLDTYLTRPRCCKRRAPNARYMGW